MELKSWNPMSGTCSIALIFLSVILALLTWSSSTHAATIHRRFQQRGDLQGNYQYAPNSRVGQGQRMNMGQGGQMQPALEPPRRPASFASMDELNQYLEDLQKYYALLGRPRFGRGVHIPQELDGLEDS